MNFHCQQLAVDQLIQHVALAIISKRANMENFHKKENFHAITSQVVIEKIFFSSPHTATPFCLKLFPF